MMKSPKPPPEDPAVKAARDREEARADQANLDATQTTLRGLTSGYRRRFGLTRGGGSSGLAPSLLALSTASLAGSSAGGSTGFNIRPITGGGRGGRGGGDSLVDYL